MKFIHFSDTHIDAYNIGPMDPTTGVNGRTMDTLDLIDSIIEFASDEKVDLVIFSGDAFHKPNPSPVMLNLFSKRIMRLRDMCPVVMVAGNHDIGRLATSLDVFSSLEIPGVVVGNTYDVYDVADIYVITAPYPNKYMDIPDGKTPTEYAIDRITDLSNSYGDKPCILVGHFTIAGAVYGAERDMIMGSDVDIPINVVARGNWCYVAMGHIHYRQSVENKYGTPVVYAGSIDRVSFGEEKQSKGFVYGEISKTGKCTWEFIDTDARSYKTIEVSVNERTLRPSDKVVAKIVSTDLKGAVVRVMVHIPATYVGVIDVNQITVALQQAGVYCIQIISIIPVRDNIQRMTTSEFNVGMSHVKLLEKFLEDEDPKQRKLLLSDAKDIMGDLE